MKTFNRFGFSQVESELDFLKGKVLTIIDATYTNQEQLKAVKDLLHDSFGTAKNHFYRHFFGLEQHFMCSEFNKEEEIEEGKGETATSLKQGKVK